jgi:hypothetical protein
MLSEHRKVNLPQHRYLSSVAANKNCTTPPQVNQERLNNRAFVQLTRLHEMRNAHVVLARSTSDAMEIHAIVKW